MRTRPPTLELNPRLEHLVCDLAREGVALVDIAQGLGIGERTARRWLHEGRHSHRPPYHRFAEGYADAELERRAIVSELLASARERLEAPSGGQARSPAQSD